MDEDFEETGADVVIIGSGVGGGAVARQLAGCGLRLLILERGGFLPDEPQIAEAQAVFVEARYRSQERWLDPKGRSFRPGQYYQVGGHTKFYGTAMFRFRESDFAETRHEGGLSPAWPVDYATLAPFYAEAERIFGVRGAAGLDPTEPARDPYPHGPIPHEPVIGRVAAALAAQGLHPFPMPAAVDLGPGGRCLRCGSCDAFACRVDAKGDAETRLIRPLLGRPEVTLWTGAEVTRLRAAPDGRITGIELVHEGRPRRIRARAVVLSAGAINSALILLRSADAHHPAGLANRSGVVGRYLMNHHLTGLIGLGRRRNDTRFPKTLAMNDFYHGLPDDPDARGNLQMLGRIQAPMIRAAVPLMPRRLAGLIAAHGVAFLCMSEDLPDRDSRVRLLPSGQVEVDWRPGDLAAHDRFVRHMRRRLRALFPLVLRHPFGISAPSHQCGTVRMGTDPAQSALDPWCRAHDHANLHVVDAGFFPSSAALNPALTVCAQALRVGAHLRTALQPGRAAA